MSNRTYHNIAAGWLRENGKGDQYISCVANGEKSKVKLFAQLEDGNTVPVDSFAVFFNKDEDKKSAKSPDVRLTFSTES